MTRRLDNATSEECSRTDLPKYSSSYGRPIKKRRKQEICHNSSLITMTITDLCLILILMVASVTCSIFIHISNIKYMHS